MLVMITTHQLCSSLGVLTILHAVPDGDDPTAGEVQGVRSEQALQPDTLAPCVGMVLTEHQSEVSWVVFLSPCVAVSFSL